MIRQLLMGIVIALSVQIIAAHEQEKKIDAAAYADMHVNGWIYRVFPQYVHKLNGTSSHTKEIYVEFRNRLGSVIRTARHKQESRIDFEYIQELLGDLPEGATVKWQDATIKPGPFTMHDKDGNIITSATTKDFCSIIERNRNTGRTLKQAFHRHFNTVVSNPDAMVEKLFQEKE